MIGLGIRCNAFNGEFMLLAQILSAVALEWCNSALEMRLLQVPCCCCSLEGRGPALALPALNS